MVPNQRCGIIVSAHGDKMSLKASQDSERDPVEQKVDKPPDDPEKKSEAQPEPFALRKLVPELRQRKGATEFPQREYREAHQEIIATHIV